MQFCETGHHMTDGELHENEGVEHCTECAVAAGFLDDEGNYLPVEG